MTDLSQTKNSFKLIGKVTRIDKDGAYKEEVTNKVGSKRNGETYRSLRFGVKTSDTNDITVQMFDYEPTEVFLWNSDKKKADSNYKGDRVPFGEWEENQDTYREQGYTALQTRVGLVYGEDGKLQSHGLPSFVASQEIYHNLNNGDFVVVEGEIRYSMYKNREDKEVEQKTYTIKKLFKLKEAVDFEAEDFEEVTYFEQEMVFVGADIDKAEGKCYVTGRVIDFAKNFHDTQMVINFKNSDGSFDAGMVKLADAFNKRFKFGDVINVFGDVVNRLVVEEKEEDESQKDDLFAEFGGKKKPKHAETFVSRTYIQEMTINGVDAWDKGVYSEDDFVKQDLIEEDKNPFKDELGGKEKKKGKNPFENDGVDISEEDLPF